APASCSLESGLATAGVFDTPVLLFSKDTATTEIYTLSLHDALPIYAQVDQRVGPRQLQNHEQDQAQQGDDAQLDDQARLEPVLRSEEHTSELQSRENLVCRLLLEKKKNIKRHSDARTAS